MKIHGACPHDCPDTCGFITEVQDGRAVAFYPDPHNPITEGWLCAKVRPYLDHVYHPERLTHPLRRTSPKDAPPEFERISWAEAIAEIGANGGRLSPNTGRKPSCPTATAAHWGWCKWGWPAAVFGTGLGASQLERSICGAAAEQAVNLTLGARQRAV
jgi:anaerobic selenocysteine-containing dehydrogenase